MSSHSGIYIMQAGSSRLDDIDACVSGFAYYPAKYQAEHRTCAYCNSKTKINENCQSCGAPDRREPKKGYFWT